MEQCHHCGLDIPATGSSAADAARFCCHGCEAAYALVQGLGLDRYYQRRSLDPEARLMRPDEEAGPVDYSAHVTTEPDGTAALHLMVEGIQCAACVWLIETVLARRPGVVSARLNMTTRRLVLRWNPAETVVAALVEPVLALGYRLVPYDPAALGQEAEKATRDLLHWISALIALSAVVYAGLPFYRSAFAALRAGRVNMDVPISLAVILAAGMSLFETITSGQHAYFDSAVTLLFFLLVGRYLDRRARGRARGTAEQLLTLGAAAVTVIEPDGSHRVLPPAQVVDGMAVFAAAGDRIAVDGVIESGRSDLDTSLITGETVPVAVEPGARVFAGTLNMSGPLTIRAVAVGEGTLLAEIVRLMETAEQGRAKYVAIADRVARLYAPVVHGLAAATFVGWLAFTAMGWQEALLIAIAVLIITCPCALALAVPEVQVIASGRLLRQGILLKSATALERLARADTVVFDKTGTLTTGRPELVDAAAVDRDDLALAGRIAGASRHPLSRALARAAESPPVAEGVREEPGRGLRWPGPDGEVRLGSRAWCGIEDGDTVEGPELWLARPGAAPVPFRLSDAPRADAADVVGDLRRRGYRLELLSGDRAPAVAAVAARVGIADWQAGATPAEKCDRLDDLAGQGRRVLMVGDGLNDAPALAAASVSMSPSTAVDVSQTAADVVFQGDRLYPVAEVLEVAGRADRLVKQNFAIAFLYNAVTIPAAVMGYVTPLIAAIAMSASSLVVILNALRLSRRSRTTGR